MRVDGEEMEDDPASLASAPRFFVPMLVCCWREARVRVDEEELEDDPASLRVDEEELEDDPASLASAPRFFAPFLHDLSFLMGGWAWASMAPLRRFLDGRPPLLGRNGGGCNSSSGRTSVSSSCPVPATCKDLDSGMRVHRFGVNEWEGVSYFSVFD